MLNVLHFSPKLSAGGTGALASDLAEALEQSGQAHNIVLAPSGKRGSGILYVEFPVRSMALFGGAVLHSLLCKTAVNVIVAYTELAAWVAGRACRKLPASQRPKIVGALTAYPHKHLFGCGWRGCHAFSTVSRHLRGEWERFSPVFRSKTPWVIPYGTSESLCHPAYRPQGAWKMEWDARFGKDPGELSICLPAPLTPLHGHEDLVPMLAALRRNNISPRVYIVGDYAKASPRYVEHLKDMFRKAQLERSIVWLGARPDLRDVLCACDITISLDRQPASYNRPLQEALCLGRPVVAYDHGAAGELLSVFLPEGRVAPGQAEAMADTITQWSFYPPATVNSIPYPYSLTNTAENYLELFHSLRP